MSVHVHARSYSSVEEPQLQATQRPKGKLQRDACGFLEPHRELLISAEPK